MQNDKFELAFSEFLERKSYDQAEAAIFALVRAAFLAGWKAREYQNPVEFLPVKLHKREEQA